MLWLLYPQGKSPRYPLDRRLGGSHSLSGWHAEEKILDPTGTQIPTPQSSSLYPVVIPTALSRPSIENGIWMKFWGPFFVELTNEEKIIMDIFSMSTHQHAPQKIQYKDYELFSINQ
jgi:hypothetical protein